MGQNCDRKERMRMRNTFRISSVTCSYLSSDSLADLCTEYCLLDMKDGVSCK